MKYYIFTLLFVGSFVFSAFAQQSERDRELTDFQTIEIKIDHNKWRYVLDSLFVNGDDMVTAMVKIDGQTYQKAKLRYEKSSASKLGEKRNPLFVQLPDNKGELRLSNSFRDPSELRELMAAWIIGKYMPVPSVRLAKVQINGEFYALLSNVESVNDAFFKKHYGNSKGKHFVSAPKVYAKSDQDCIKNINALEYTNHLHCYESMFKSSEDKKVLQQLSETLSTQPQNTSKQLAVDEVLWMLAANNVLVNLDSYTGKDSPNYHLYQDEAGVFHPIHGQMNFSFGAYKNTGEGSDLSVEELVKLDPLLHKYNERKPLIHQLLKDERNQKIYISHMRTILQEFFWNGKFEKTVVTLHERIKPILTKNEYDLTRFENSLLSTTGERSKIPGLVQFMNDRAAFLKKHPIMTVLPSTIGDVQLKKREAYSSDKIEAFEFQIPVDRFPKEVVLYYRFSKMGDFSQIVLNDAGKNGDLTSADDIYGVKLLPKDGDTIEYYIFVENAGAVTFEPSDYFFKRQKRSLKELNR